MTCSASCSLTPVQGVPSEKAGSAGFDPEFAIYETAFITPFVDQQRRHVATTEFALATGCGHSCSAMQFTEA